MSRLSNFALLLREFLKIKESSKPMVIVVAGSAKTFSSDFLKDPRLASLVVFNFLNGRSSVRRGLKSSPRASLLVVCRDIATHKHEANLNKFAKRNGLVRVGSVFDSNEIQKALQSELAQYPAENVKGTTEKEEIDLEKETPVEKPKVIAPATSKSEPKKEFALAFMEAVNGDPEGTLSKNRASILTRKFLGVPASKCELLVGILSIQKIGSYKASGKLLDLVRSIKEEPEEPKKKAKWLVEQKPIWQKEVEELQARLQDLRAKLARVQKAEKTLETAQRLFDDI